MRWIKCSLYTAAEGMDAVCAMLSDASVAGLQLEDEEELRRFLNTPQAGVQWDYVDEDLLSGLSACPGKEPRVIFYLGDDPEGGKTLRDVKDGIERLKRGDFGIDLGPLRLETETVEDDWLEKWKESYKPFELGERLVICPSWERYDDRSGRIIVTLEPGNAFGTGLHQTTQLCLLELERYVKPGDDVLDLGCGSGILSVAAVLLGARSALAVDSDPGAARSAAENAGLNAIPRGRYAVLHGDILRDGALKERVASKKYDIVVANIVADVIIAITDFAAECAADGGLYIVSGIIDDRLDDVIGKLESAGMKIVSVSQRDAWMCAVAAKNRRL